MCYQYPVAFTKEVKQNIVLQHCKIKDIAWQMEEVHFVQKKAETISGSVIEY